MKRVVPAPSSVPEPKGNLHRLRLLATDTLLYGAAAAVSKSIGLILFPFLTHNLTVANYGRLDLALYGAQLFGLVMIWGQDSAVARLFFQDEEVHQRQQIISQALLTMAFNLVVCIAALAALGRTSLARSAFGEQTAQLIGLLLIYAPLTGLLSFCQSTLKWTFRRARYITLALGVPGFNLVLILVLVRFTTLGPVMALSIMTAVAAVFAALAMFFIREWLVIPRSVEYLRHLIPLALPYGVIACITALSPLFERAIVSNGFGAFDLGLYASAAKVASIAMMLSIAFQMGWGPFAYSIYKQADAARTYSLVLRAFSVIMCLTVLFISAISGPLMTLLAGGRYRAAAAYVFPIAMAFGVQAIGWITEIGIHLSKRTYLNLVGFTLFVVISMSGIVYFSRLIGIVGVAAGTLAGQLAMLVTSAILAQKACRMNWSYGMPAATVLVTLACGGAAIAAARMAAGPDPVLIYVVGMIVVVIMNVFFGVAREDRRRIGNLARGFFRPGASA